MDEADYNDDQYIDLPEQTFTTGATRLPLLEKMTRRCQEKAKGTDAPLMVRCIASKRCKSVSAGKRNRSRNLKHAKSCRYLPSNLQKEAISALASKHAQVQPASVTQTTTPPQKTGPSCQLDLFRRSSPQSVDKQALPPVCGNIEQQVQRAMLQHITRQQNLTISFDGGKIRRPQSIYTFHITTPERESFLLDLDNASQLSHTANYINGELENVSLAQLHME